MISISVEILKKSRFRSKFSKNLDFGRNFRKISIVVKFFSKSLFLSKFLKNFDIGPKFSKKSRFRSKFEKKKISIPVEIFKKTRFKVAEDDIAFKLAI